VSAWNAAAQEIEEAVGAREAGLLRKEDARTASSVDQLVYRSAAPALTLAPGTGTQNSVLVVVPPGDRAQQHPSARGGLSLVLFMRVGCWYAACLVKFESTCVACFGA
jgi:hypothetical protein